MKFYARWHPEEQILEPLRHYAPKLSAKINGPNTVLLTFEEERSQPSHRHYFAVINTAWSNLPEDMAVDFPTAEHLRKFALIKTGYCEQRTMVCKSVSEARRWVMFAKLLDGYCVATSDKRVVTIYTAKSQSLEEMSAKTFQKSKDEVFEVLSQLLGVDVTTLTKNGGDDAD